MSGRRRGWGYLCGLDEDPVADTTSDCSERDKHTPAPLGYVAWHNWARRMMATHRQRRCPGCGLWQIWLPKKAA